MAKQLNWLILEKTIRSAGLSLFSPQDLHNLLDGSDISLRFLLTRAVKKGFVLKLRRCLYALADQPPADVEVANALYSPSYISFAFALAYYDVIPEAVYAVTSATPRATATFTVLGKSFVYHRIKSAAFTGYHLEPVHGRHAWIAEPEKALVDTLYFVLLKKQTLSDRLNTSTLSKKKMRAFAELFGRSDLLDMVESL